MANYLIDTNILSYLADKNSSFHKNVSKSFQALKQSDELFISLITFYEFEYGISLVKEQEGKQVSWFVSEFLEIFPVLPMNKEGSKIFGDIKKQFKDTFGSKDKDLIKHNFDIIIASMAILEKAVLVSNDKIFSKIVSLRKDFKLEDWTK